MNHINHIKNKAKYLVFFAFILHQNLHGQVNLLTSIQFAHLAYSDIGGIQFNNALEYSKKKSVLSVKCNFIYALGNRDFNKLNGEYYTLLDGDNRQDYPLPGIIPGLPESAYIKAYKLNTAKTIDVGFTASYGKTIINSEKHKLGIGLGLNFSWIEESSIQYNYKGDLTNVLGTSKDIYLVVPFTQNFFDLGPQVSMQYELLSKKKTSFGSELNTTWLSQTGFKYSVGPTFTCPL